MNEFFNRFAGAMAAGLLLLALAYFLFTAEINSAKTDIEASLTANVGTLTDAINNFSIFGTKK